MNRTFGLLVTYNEASRYLQSILEHNRPQLDELIIVDDRSTDETPAIAAEYGQVRVRPDDYLSFAEHEGKFRSLAWHYLSEANPQYGDIIISFDADEYLLSDDLTAFQGAAARVAIDECWQIRGRDDRPMIRTDKAWGRIDDVRAWHWQPGLQVEAANHLMKGRVGRNSDKQRGDVASGCGPYQSTREWHNGLRIMHVGYLDPEDRLAKQQRYHKDGRHGSGHVASITERGRLTASAHNVRIWTGSTTVEEE